MVFIFTGFRDEMFEFAMQLRFNNNKEFMHAHRDEYIAKMRDPFYQLIDSLAPLMLRIDPAMEVRPNKVLSRIFRDTRFSRDKSPYRDHHWIAFRRAGEPRDQSLMFWFEVRIDSLNWGLGFWGENRPAMEMMRRRMISHPDDLLDLLPCLKGRDLVISGDQHKRLTVPEELKAELRPYYLLKDFYISRQNAQREWIYSQELLRRLEQDFSLLAPFYQLLRGYHEIAVLEGNHGSV